MMSRYVTFSLSGSKVKRSITLNVMRVPSRTVQSYWKYAAARFSPELLRKMSIGVMTFLADTPASRSKNRPAGVHQERATSPGHRCEEAFHCAVVTPAEGVHVYLKHANVIVHRYLRWSSRYSMDQTWTKRHAYL